VNTLEEFNEVRKSSAKSVLLIWADWQEASDALKDVLVVLAGKFGDVSFVSVDTELCPDVSSSLNITVVPAVLCLTPGSVYGSVLGVNPAEISKLVKKFGKETTSSSASTTVFVADNSEVTTEVLNARLKQLINTAPVMLFMKGTPAAPRCGFSRKMTALLSEHAVPFASFDILEDEQVRQGLKKFSDWPTYPQLYVHGELQGGLDILQEMAAGGNLKGELKISESALTVAQGEASLDKRLHALINTAPFMLFMKGTPGAEQCGFSRTIVGLLQEGGVEFSSFNILSDEEVRQGLKKYSDWPTYPQLYVNGQLAGGLDIVKELQEEATQQGKSLQDVLKANV